MFETKGPIIDKENSNDNNLNLSKLPNNVTGSVPSRLSSKVASSSFIKGSPAKNSYFSPNWKYAPYHNTHAHPPVYKK